MRTDTIEGRPMFPVGTMVSSHVFHDPDTPKRIARATWDGVEYRYVVKDAAGVSDYGYLAKDFVEAG